MACYSRIMSRTDGLEKIYVIIKTKSEDPETIYFQFESAQKAEAAAKPILKAIADTKAMHQHLSKLPPYNEFSPSAIYDYITDAILAEPVQPSPTNSSMIGYTLSLKTSPKKRSRLEVTLIDMASIMERVCRLPLNKEVEIVRITAHQFRQL